MLAHSLCLSLRRSQGWQKNEGSLFWTLWERKNHAACLSLSIGFIQAEQAGCLDINKSGVFLIAKRTSYIVARWWSFRGLPVCRDPCPPDLYHLHTFLLGISPLSTCLQGQDHRSKAPVLALVTAQLLLTIISWRVDLSSYKVSKLGSVYRDKDSDIWQCNT